MAAAAAASVCLFLIGEIGRVAQRRHPITRGVATFGGALVEESRAPPRQHQHASRPFTQPATARREFETNGATDTAARAADECHRPSWPWCRSLATSDRVLGTGFRQLNASSERLRDDAKVRASVDQAGSGETQNDALALHYSRNHFQRCCHFWGRAGRCACWSCSRHLRFSVT